MATTRGWLLKGNITDAVNYILDLKNNESKTFNGYYTYTSYQDATPLTSMYALKQECKNKDNRFVGYHFQFSLARGEGTSDECLMLAREWFETISNNNVNYVIAVHDDTKNIHAHIISSYYQKNGIRWNVFWKRDTKRFRAISDRICKAHGFSVLEKTSEKGRHYFEWMNDKTDNNRLALKKILDEVIQKVTTYDDLKKYMEKIGFKFYDNSENLNPNIFTFTADVKLINKQADDTYRVRIPYQKEYIEVPSEYVKWIKENKTLKVMLPIDKQVQQFDKDGIYLDKLNISDLKIKFEEKNAKGRTGLRIKVPNAKKVIRTKFLDEEADYSLDGIQKMIQENGRFNIDPDIKKFIESDVTFEKMRDEQRSIFQSTNVKLNFNSNIYKSMAQENYFKWKSITLQKVIDKNNYQYLLEKDRRNLSFLKERKAVLQNELKKCYESIEEIEKSIESMIKDHMEGIVNISDKEFNNYIIETKGELLAKKDELKKMIHLYGERIKNVEKINELENKDKNRLRSRIR